MKKLDHEQRIELAKSRISKSTSKSKTKLTLRQKKIASLIGTSVIAVGASAGITAAIVIEAKKDRTLVYPSMPHEMRAADFVYDKDYDKSEVREEYVGSQKVVYAKKGPVNFVSNYSRLMNKEKIEDWLEWFYHDVSWGPEISTLSNISFLSGVQADNGVITLGYHTSSRDSSTIVLSPDVQTASSVETNTNQALAYHMFKNMSDLTNALFPGATADAPTGFGKMAYRMVVENKYKSKILNDNNGQPASVSFANTFGRLMTTQASFLKSGRAVYRDTATTHINPLLLPAESMTNFRSPKGNEAHWMPETYTDEANTTRTAVSYRVQDLLATAKAHWNDSSITFQDKINWLSLLSIKWDQPQEAWAAIFGHDNTAENNKRVNALFDHFLATDFFKSAITLNGFTADLKFSDTETMSGGQIKPEWESFLKFKPNEQSSRVSTLYNLTSLEEQDANTEHHHLRTIAKLFEYSNDKGEVRKAFSELLGMANPIQKNSKEEKMSAVLSVLYFYLAHSTVSGGLVGKSSLGDRIFYETYKELLNMNAGQIENISADYLFNHVDLDGSFVKKLGYSADEIKTIKDRKVAINSWYTELAQHLDEKYHSGKEDPKTGKRVPGIPIWKPNDTMYDAIVRRASQDIMYTVSHEYGHHTTLFQAENISAYDGVDTIGPNAVVSGAPLPAIVTNTEVTVKPELSSLVSGEKYRIFREAFSSTPYFQSIIDKASDGDSRTDISVQIYNDRLNIDFQSAILESTVNTLEPGIENYRIGEIFEVAPEYFGQTRTGFAYKNISLEYQRQITKPLINAYSTGNLLENKDWTFEEHVNLLDEAYDTLNTISKDSKEFQGDPTTFPATISALQGYLKKGMDKDQTWLASVTYKYAGNEIDSTNFGDKTTAEQPYVFPLLLEIYPNLDQKDSIFTEAETNAIKEAIKYIYLSDDKIASVDPEWGSLNVNLVEKPDEWNKNVQGKRDQFKLDHKDLYEKIVLAITRLNSKTGISLMNTYPIAFENSSKVWELVDHEKQPEAYAYHEYSASQILFLRAYRDYYSRNSTTADINNFIDTYIDSNIVTLNAAKDAWELVSSPTIPNKENFTKDTFGIYLTKMKDEILKTHSSLNGELWSRYLFEQAGKTTKEVFNGLFSRNEHYNDEHYNNYFTDENGVEHKLDLDYGNTIDDKFLVWKVFMSLFRTTKDKAKGSYTTFETLLKATGTTAAEVVVDNKTYRFRLDSNFIDNVIHHNFSTDKVENPNRGGMLLPMNDGPQSVGAVVYVFNQNEDQAAYRTTFSTVAPGTTPPSSYLRYTTYYAESLTRALNQIGFNQFPELASTFSAYLDGDRTRFQSFGVKMYHNDIKGGTGGVHKTVDNTITATGEKVKEMFKKFLGTDKELSSIVRNYQSGKYTFIGYSDINTTYKALVFTDLQGNIVNKTKMIYGVDNYHYYTRFMDPTSMTKLLTTRHSWMTEFSPMGNWQNTLLREGNYKIKFWNDINQNDVIDKGELVALTNKQVTGNGQLNSNGKTDATAEIVGNPDMPRPPVGATTEANAYKNAEYIFRVTNILL